jgi:hypothetical protein
MRRRRGHETTPGHRREGSLKPSSRSRADVAPIRPWVQATTTTQPKRNPQSVAGNRCSMQVLQLGQQAARSGRTGNRAWNRAWCGRRGQPRAAGAPVTRPARGRGGPPQRRADTGAEGPHHPSSPCWPAVTLSDENALSRSRAPYPRPQPATTPRTLPGAARRPVLDPPHRPTVRRAEVTGRAGGRPRS